MRRVGWAALAALGVLAASAGTAGQARAAGTYYRPPLQVAPDNQPRVVKVLVLNYNPRVPSEGNRRLSQVFGWNEPEKLAAEYKAALEDASGGAVRFEMVEWRNLNEIYAQVDGHRYTVEEYVRNRRQGGGWHDGGGADYPRLLQEQGVPARVDRGEVDEVWIFSDHFFGLWEASMAGPGAFFINGGVYPQVPTRRPFAFYGFNYERGVAEMLHNTCHRTEATMNRFYGEWRLDNPQNNWELFSANDRQSGGRAGVGTCHWPANAEQDYDYGNPRTVQSWADAFYAYPRLNLVKKPVSAATWAVTGDPHFDYMKWYFGHLPRAAGLNADGRQNNWWKYLYDFANYAPNGAPLPARAWLVGPSRAPLGSAALTLQVAYSAPVPVKVASLGDTDLLVQGPAGLTAPAVLVGLSDAADGTHRVATYRVAAPGGTWDAAEAGTWRVSLRSGEVRDTRDRAFPAVQIGQAVVLQPTSQASGLPSDADTTLLLRGENSLVSVEGRSPVLQSGITYGPGVVGQSFRVGGQLRYGANLVSPSQGTLEFWLRPDFDPNDARHRALFEVGDNFNRGLLVMLDGAVNFRLMQWGDDPATATVEADVERGVGTSAAGWQRGAWRHLAVTWHQNGQLAIYVNGRLMEASSNGIRLNGFSTPYFSLAAETNGEGAALADWDEVRLSRRARGAAEIQADYERGLALRALRVAPDAFRLARGEALELAATGEYDGGESRDLTDLVAWRSSSGGVVRMEGSRARGAGFGTATVTAALGAVSASAAAAVAAPDYPQVTSLSALSFTVWKGRTEPYRFTVTYRGLAALAAATLGPGSVRVTGPAQLHAFAAVAGRRFSADGLTAVVTYQLDPPAGGWQPHHAGVYRLELEGWQVGDTQGRFAPDRALGTFTISYSPFVP